MFDTVIKSPLPPLPTVERNECPNCESMIPSQFVFGRFDLQESPPTRNAAVYCIHCDRFYEADFELRGGAWSLTSDVRVITHARRLESLRRKVQQIGSIQLAQSA
jgi:hypothetical protein